MLERSAHADSLVLGPGLGRDPQTIGFTRELAPRAALPLVLDADGLFAFAVSAAGVNDSSTVPAGAAAIGALSARTAPTVLTPHAGELARMLGVESGSIGARRLRSANAVAAAANAVVVLKGDDTLIVDPGGLVAISSGAAPALATAGSGDVLAGMIGAYLAKRMEPFTAASAAVYLHAETARMLAAELGGEGIIAGDVIAALPRALARRGR
jgi:ADP-dependent NAD(P)H-hydrate dehydratase / NAD(P)H-hydrate epimerase